MLLFPKNSLIARLHTELRNLRQAYLSTAAPRKTHLRVSAARPAPSQPVYLTDRDREEIDANAKMTLRDLNARIRALEDAEQLRQSTEAALLRKRLSRGLGALGSWATGGKTSEQAAARQLGAHRESVIWYLRTRLQETTRTQQRMMETRLAREMEKNRSVLAKASSTTTRSALMAKATASHEATTGPAAPARIPQSLAAAASSTTGLPPEEGPRNKPTADNLTEEQVQIFEKGNQDMLKHLESTLDKVRQVFLTSV
jgi:hypothetical protein